MGRDDKPFAAKLAAPAIPIRGPAGHSDAERRDAFFLEEIISVQNGCWRKSKERVGQLALLSSDAQMVPN